MDEINEILNNKSDEEEEKKEEIKSIIKDKPPDSEYILWLNDFIKSAQYKKLIKELGNSKRFDVLQ